MGCVSSNNHCQRSDDVYGSPPVVPSRVRLRTPPPPPRALKSKSVTPASSSGVSSQYSTPNKSGASPQLPFECMTSLERRQKFRNVKRRSIMREIEKIEVSNDFDAVKATVSPQRSCKLQRQRPLKKRQRNPIHLYVDEEDEKPQNDEVNIAEKFGIFRRARSLLLPKYHKKNNAEQLTEQLNPLQLAVANYLESKKAEEEQPATLNLNQQPQEKQQSDLNKSCCYYSLSSSERDNSDSDFESIYSQPNSMLLRTIDTSHVYENVNVVYDGDDEDEDEFAQPEAMKAYPAKCHVEMEIYFITRSTDLLLRTSTPILRKRDGTLNVSNPNIYKEPPTEKFLKWSKELTTSSYDYLNITVIPEAISGKFSPHFFPAYTNLECKQQQSNKEQQQEHMQVHVVEEAKEATEVKTKEVADIRFQHSPQPLIYSTSVSPAPTLEHVSLPPPVPPRALILSPPPVPKRTCSLLPQMHFSSAPVMSTDL